MTASNPVKSSATIDPYTLTVPLGERSYDIVIGEGLLQNIARHIQAELRQPRVFIITDNTVARHYIETVTASFDTHAIEHRTMTVPAGESSKCFATLERVTNELLSHQPDRKSTILALGGGVVGDLAGFIASACLRGIDFIQVPTTLLAQVDSSVGGKTGINVPSGKNLVGAFHQPRKVIIDINTLHTLPKREFLAGYAEIVKYGLLGDAPFFEWLKQALPNILNLDPTALAQAIFTSCQAKSDIVGKDEREGGIRALLNLGHTFGHSLETEMKYDGRLLHGEAVSIGMVMAADMSVKLGYIEKEARDDIQAHLKQAGLPTSPLDIAKRWNVDALCNHFYSDKKTESGELTFVVLDKIGKAVVRKQVDPALAREVIEEAVA
ncbi:MAG: 3-dehydroquinate synthase [Rickettsiales bacterium]|nr:3-dehydroquinate synthase [Rickettsiales bacterium]